MPTKDPVRRAEQSRKAALKYYHKNKVRLAEENRLRNHQRLAWFYEYKGTLHCVDCGPEVPWHHCQLDFDHLNDKKYNVTEMVASGHSREAVLAEISKCEVVCANHHRLRTWSRHPRRAEDHL